MINPETSLLALCIKYPDMVPVIRTSVSAKMFTGKKNAEVFKACLMLKAVSYTNLTLPTKRKG